MNFKQWFNVFLVISEAWQGYDSKAYGVLNHNLKLQCKKFSRMRDIQYFPTQGWAGTAFCTRKRSETYVKKVMTSQIRTTLGVFNTEAAMSLSIGQLYLLYLTACDSLSRITVFPNTNLELLAHYLYCVHCGRVLRAIFSGNFIVHDLLLKHVYNSQRATYHNMRQKFMITKLDNKSYSISLTINNYQ